MRNSIDRRLLPIAALAFAAAACTRDAPVAAPPAPPRTIVLVTVDTLRADHLPFHGYPRPTAPFLERLTREGASFTNCVSASATTAPSHASIFTSLPPSVHGLVRNGLHLDESVPTLAESLAALGYETGAFTSVSFLRGVKKGFQRFATRRKDDEGAKETRLTIGAYLPADVVVDRALQWLERREPDAKVFLWVHVYDVHQWKSDDVPPDALAELKRRDAENPDGPAEYGEYAIETFGAEPASQKWGPYRFREIIDNYDAQIVFADGELERLYDAMRAGGRGDAAWFVTSDHGEGLGEHGYESHGRYLYEEQLHVPLVVHFTDGRYAGEVRDELVRTTDLYRTIEGLVTDTASPHAQGRSVLPLLSDARAKEERRIAFGERRPVDENKVRIGWSDESLHSIRSRRYKYIRRGASADEFYDLRDDPREAVNLIDRPSEERDDLARRLEAHVEMLSTKDQGAGTIDPAFLEELEQLGYIK